MIKENSAKPGNDFVAGVLMSQVTYKCDRVCPECYFYGKGKPKLRPLSLEQWKNEVIDGLDTNVVKKIILSGGEATLLGDELIERVSYIKEKHPDIIIQLNSHGGKLGKKPELAVRLKEAGLDEVQISINSHLPEVHDQTQGGVEGAWLDTVAGIKSSVKAGLFVTTNSLVFPENITHFPDLIRLLADLKVNEMSITEIYPHGRAGKDFQRFDWSEYSEELAESLSVAVRIALDVGLNLYINGFGELMLGRKFKYLNTLTVDPSGQLLVDDVKGDLLD